MEIPTLTWKLQQQAGVRRSVDGVGETAGRLLPRGWLGQGLENGETGRGRRSLSFSLCLVDSPRPSLSSGRACVLSPPSPSAASSPPLRFLNSPRSESVRPIGSTTWRFRLGPTSRPGLRQVRTEAGPASSSWAWLGPMSPRWCSAGPGRRWQRSMLGVETDGGCAVRDDEVVFVVGWEMAACTALRVGLFNTPRLLASKAPIIVGYGKGSGS